MRNPFGRFGVLFLALTLIYILSSGPILATACRLREFTGYDGWYATFIPYWPLLTTVGRDSFVIHYIEWWFAFAGAVGPG
ncbi:hypothetical protein [Paludisphaera rhizosphaerae]|uniref:hypothetical protein n=1 Tax=Paludisphaera rhizosphaerae TaxID=2711216 RepID=UPI0013EB000A|nr:hypothetical protein [Paludisphaera rhizosphaerae]